MKELKNKFKELPVYKTLTDGQRKFCDELFSGTNILLTGPAGSGKSFILTCIMDFLEREMVSVSKTAMTGVAALNISGSTLHSWSGIGLAEGEPEELVKKVKYNKKAKERIKHCEILLIDEISMASALLIDKLDFIFRFIRRKQHPFGGIQMVFIGDFLQLPPVFRSSINERELGFAFKAKAWERAAIKTVFLDEIKRQDNNSEFTQMLNLIRVGDTSKINVLSSRINGTFSDNKIKPVKIFCKNIDVSRINEEELNKIPGQVYTFYATDTGPENHIKSLDKNCKAPSILKLKIGAQVMLLTNVDVDMGLVNGSVGVVEGFVGIEGNSGIEVRFTNNVRSTITKSKWEIKEEEVGIDGKIRSKVVAKREQIPLCLAWATTVHKSQGSTIDRAEIDVSDAFAAGQIYVALSRVRDLNSLIVKPFSHRNIIVDKECLDFYKNADKIRL